MLTLASGDVTHRSGPHLPRHGHEPAPPLQRRPRFWPGGLAKDLNRPAFRAGVDRNVGTTPCPSAPAALADRALGGAVAWNGTERKPFVGSKCTTRRAVVLPRWDLR